MAQKNKSVLVIDDSTTARLNLVMMLNELKISCDIVEAQDGVDALEKLESSPKFSLILLDVNMPRLDGMGFLEAARQTGALKGSPVVMITADDSRAMIMAALQNGAADYLVKPVVKEELVDIFNKYFFVTVEAGTSLEF